MLWKYSQYDKMQKNVKISIAICDMIPFYSNIYTQRQKKKDWNAECGFVWVIWNYGTSEIGLSQKF